MELVRVRLRFFRFSLHIQCRSNFFENTLEKEAHINCNERFCRSGIQFEVDKNQSMDTKVKRFLSESHKSSKIWTATRSCFRIYYCFTKDITIAETIAGRVMDSVKGKTNPVVVELNSGLGLIGKALFEKGLDKLVIYEPFSFPLFQEFLADHKEKVELHNMNVLGKVKPRWFCKLYDSAEKFVDQDLTLIIMGANRLFFRELVYLIFYQNSTFGSNMEIFTTTSDRIYKCITDIEQPMTCLYDYASLRLFYNLEILEEFPREAFLPKSKQNLQKMYLIKVTRKESPIPIEDLLIYDKLLRLLSRKKYDAIIKTLEKWFPGCGPYLISKGISVTMPSCELAHDEVMVLLNLIKKGLKYENTLGLINFFRESDEVY